MRRLIALMLITSPAVLSAQIAPGPITIRPDSSATGSLENEVARERIREGRKSGSLNKGQARALRKEARMNDALAKHYGRDGLSDSEQRELDMRGRALQSLTEAQRSQPPRH